ncbi:hypothetical protein J6590_086124 [Homalodisca vitripennis]|nr:hypothetical protein J6590_086124 [Homalodisca vitripennis]
MYLSTSRDNIEEGLRNCEGTLRDALGLPLLESRRRYLDLMFLHRLLNGSIDCPDLLGMVDLRVPVGGTRSRDLFGKTHQLTSYGYHSIIPRLL